MRLSVRRSLPPSERKAPFVEPILQKRTKIVATIGPASRDRAILRSLFVSGVNVLRLNFSHGTPGEHAEVIANARAISAELEHSNGDPSGSYPVRKCAPENSPTAWIR